MSIDYISHERQIQRRANLALRYLRTATRLQEQAKWGLIPQTPAQTASIGVYIAAAAAIAAELGVDTVPLSGNVTRDINVLGYALKPLA